MAETSVHQVGVQQAEQALAPPPGPPQDMPPTMAMAQILLCAWQAQVVCTAATLGLPDALADGPRTADEVAAELDLHAGSVYRVLRALTHCGATVVDQAGRFALTPVGETLRSDVPGSWRGMAVMVGHPLYRAGWSELAHSVRTGEPAAHKAYGMPMFDWLSETPEAARFFNDAMTSISEATNAAVVAAYDFSGIKRLVDVGGGEGSLLAAVLRATPDTRGVLFDLPHAIKGARTSQELQALGERIELDEGDFFERVPEGADGYLLKHIIHDWSDSHCERILGLIRGTIDRFGRVLLVESLLPEGNDPALTKLSDIEMLVWTEGGRERTAAEFRALLRRTGFELTRIVQTESFNCIIEAQPV